MSEAESEQDKPQDMLHVAACESPAPAPRALESALCDILSVQGR